MLLDSPIVVHTADHNLLDLHHIGIQLPQCIDQDVDADTVAGPQINPAATPFTLSRSPMLCIRAGITDSASSLSYVIQLRSTPFHGPEDFQH